MHILNEQPTVKEPAAPKPMKRFTREIPLRESHICLCRHGSAVLKNFNLVLPYGLKLGIAGESGSGKSTLIICCFVSTIHRQAEF
jgi:ABC-type bacteriocin/lantibiotic exporter with double-glycine peptidase domain